jgi:hypothetical protein
MNFVIFAHMFITSAIIILIIKLAIDDIIKEIRNPKNENETKTK